MTTLPNTDGEGIAVSWARCSCCSDGLIWLGSLRRLVNCPACQGTGRTARVAEKSPELEPVGDHEKRCGGCGQVKPHDQFSRYRAAADGMQVRCRPCLAEDKRRYQTAALDHYGHACACCGATENLSIDHVNGDGREHREALFGSQGGASTSMYRWLARNGFPDGFQTLCRPCNTSKGSGERCRMPHPEVAWPCNDNTGGN